MNRHNRFPVRGSLVATLILMLCMLVAIPMFFFNAGIRGSEFSPQLFQQREFNYRRIPGTKIRLGKTKLSPGISPCSTFILTHLVAGTRVDWHVSTVQQGSISQELGPKILVDYLSSTDGDGAQVWDAWSSKNSAHAAVLWPIVQQVAIHDLYLCVPDLLRNADRGLDISKFKKTLTLICIESARLKLKSFSAVKDRDRRNELRIWAQSLAAEYADDPEFQQASMELSDLH